VQSPKLSPISSALLKPVVGTTDGANDVIVGRENVNAILFELTPSISTNLTQQCTKRTSRQRWEEWDTQQFHNKAHIMSYR
jgi:hypothetical protein